MPQPQQDNTRTMIGLVTHENAFLLYSDMCHSSVIQSSSYRLLVVYTYGDLYVIENHDNLITLPGSVNPCFFAAETTWLKGRPLSTSLIT